MRSVSQQYSSAMRVRTFRRLRWAFHAVTASALAIIVCTEYVWPWAVERMHADEYKRLVVECDQAMHDEVVLRDPAATHDVLPAQAESLRHSGDVGLLVCHEYDKLRKRLLIAGVSEHRLALLGLEGLEVEKIPVSRMVEPHRMPRF